MLPFSLLSKHSVPVYFCTVKSNANTFIHLFSWMFTYCALHNWKRYWCRGCGFCTLLYELGYLWTLWYFLSRLVHEGIDLEQTHDVSFVGLQNRTMLDLLVHAHSCRSTVCQYTNCRKIKGFFGHAKRCPQRYSGGCEACGRIWFLLRFHARACNESNCTMPRCR
jgi:hypothetical protein